MTQVGFECGTDYLGDSINMDERDMDYPAWGQAIPWGKSEFIYADNTLRRVGFYGNAGESGLTVEFPWRILLVGAGLGAGLRGRRLGICGYEANDNALL
jgi:hypothetical protein